MFEVQHKDDAWEIGVLKACGFFDSPSGSKSPEEMGVPARLLEWFHAGCRDQRNLSDERVAMFATQWGVD